MNFLRVLDSFSKLSITGISNQARQISTKTSPLCFQVTNALFGEPLKKKKKIDPAVIRLREERKRKKIEKRIKRLQKMSQQLKPVKELEVPLTLMDQKGARTRRLPALSVNELESRVLLQKDWTRYKQKEHLQDIQVLDNILFSQRQALDELKMVSQDLYNEAIQIDLEFLPLEARGPVFTPPIKNYSTPDGEYVDITRKYEGEES